MPIDSKHPDYLENEVTWIRCTDFAEGSKPVKKKGKVYLPMPEGMTRAEYNKYLYRTCYFNGVGRTQVGLVGAMTRSPAKATLPKSIEYLEQDATGNGKTLQEFIKEEFNKIMVSGRSGILTDVGKDGKTKLIGYPELNIFNWRLDENGNLILVTLREFVLKPDSKDPYESVVEPQFRELFIDRSGQYKQRIWKKVPSKGINAKDTFEPGRILNMLTATRQPMRRIPFVFVSPVGTEANVAKAPLMDLCDINLSHYINSADLEHGRHLTALPTPWATGVDPEEHKKGLKIGSGTAWLIQSDKARVGMLEFTGQGLGHLADAIDEKQHQMAIMGAKLLQPQRKQVESAELARMANSGDESILVGIANSVGLAVTKALEFAAEWVASSEKIELVVNKDFIDTKLAPDEILALFEVYLGGAITHEEFLAQLDVGERLIGDVAKIAAQAKIEHAQRVKQQAEENNGVGNTGNPGGGRANGGEDPSRGATT